MALLTKQEIADINSVINKREMSESEAQNVLTKYIRYPDVDVDTKLNLLVALKVLLTKEFQVKDLQIKYVIDDFSSLDCLALLEAMRGDDTIIIGVDQEFLANAQKIHFLKTMLHEYGHFKMFLSTRSGKRTRKSVKVSGDIDDATWWQAIGAIFRYCSCGSERYADKFAHKEMYKLVKSEIRFFKTKYLEDVRRKAKYSQIKDDVKYYTSGVLFVLWCVGNTIFRVKQDKMYKVFQNNISNDKLLWEVNLKCPLVFEEKIVDNPEEYISHHIAEKDRSIKGFHNVKKLRILAGAYLKYSLMMASKCGVHPQELGFLFSEYYSKPEYINTRDKNPDSPLLGYFIYPTSRAQEVQSLGEFFRDLEACYNEKMSVEETNRS